MEYTFNEAIERRRTYYSIGDEPKVAEEEIMRVIRMAVRNVPSAFNSQSTRIVLLTGKEHGRLWNIVKEALRSQIPEAVFASSEAKIDKCFAGGQGTILYYEDMSVVRGLQEKFPLYRKNFPVWSQQTSAMHQFVIWTMLGGLGLGASLQHYNPLIDGEVRKTWNIPAAWKLIAEMPFGAPLEAPAPKEFQDIDSRIRVYG